MTKEKLEIYEKIRRVEGRTNMNYKNGLEVLVEKVIATEDIRCGNITEILMYPNGVVIVKNKIFKKSK